LFDPITWQRLKDALLLIMQKVFLLKLDSFVKNQIHHVISFKIKVFSEKI